MPYVYLKDGETGNIASFLFTKLIIRAILCPRNQEFVFFAPACLTPRTCLSAVAWKLGNNWPMTLENWPAKPCTPAKLDDVNIRR